jgi:transcriptional regulator with XRE-family HTH domain
VKTFSDRLKHARQMRGLTQSELARACGLSQGAISNYESASRKTAKEVFRLADILQVSAAWLATGTGPMEQEPPSCAYVLSEPPQSLGYSWPFPRISPSDLLGLGPAERTLIEDTVLSLMQSFRNKPRRR